MRYSLSGVLIVLASCSLGAPMLVACGGTTNDVNEYLWVDPWGSREDSGAADGSDVSRDANGAGGDTGAADVVDAPDVVDTPDAPLEAGDAGLDGEVGCTPGEAEVCYSGPPGTAQVGLCKQGTRTCDPTGVFGDCAGETVPVEETCNGLDDDCNGQDDDGLGSTTCGVGVCQVTTDNCVAGVTQTCTPGTASTSEECDGVDDNCNGDVDEGCDCINGSQQVCYSGPVGTLGVGICREGIQTCALGQWGACEGDVVPSSESCDNLDNDCNGQADNEDPGGGESCETGLFGECAAGTTACSGGSIVCNQIVTVAEEICDGLDNDCDGDVDDGNPGGGETCDTGMPGVCAAGLTACTGGAVACVPIQSPSAVDICNNGLDDNCDGQVDENVDADGDGWGHCDGDCCDVAGDCSQTPSLVNPGAMEFTGNLVDDDCDPSTDDTVAPSTCSSAAKFTGLASDDIAKAMELCAFTTANPPPGQKRWGVVSTQFLKANGSTPNATELANIQNWQAATLVNYGTGGVVPKKGATMAGLSTGRMRDANDPGFAAPNEGTGFSNANVSPPAAYLAAHGGSLAPGQCGATTCPTGSGAYDSLLVRLRIRVPTNARSFSYDFRFFSAEYYTYQCTIFNDYYLALLTTGAPGIPADKNISFDSLNNPVSVNNGFFEICGGNGKNCGPCPLGTGPLAGTGMEVGGTGGGTPWLTTTSPVVPGETITLDLTIFDVSDRLFDSLVLLDNFQWSLDPAVVGTND